LAAATTMPSLLQQGLVDIARLVILHISNPRFLI
jgi:hypothetical protein